MYQCEQIPVYIHVLNHKNLKHRYTLHPAITGDYMCKHVQCILWFTIRISTIVFHVIWKCRNIYGEVKAIFTHMYIVPAFWQPNYYNTIHQGMMPYEQSGNVSRISKLSVLYYK